MGENDRENDIYTMIKVGEKNDTYLEEVSGEDSIKAESQQITCSICGLTARNKAELQDHVSNAHKEATSSR
jgi:hypothetical protein